MSKKQNKPTADHWVVDEGHVIIPAFESGGVQYYMMKDIFNSFAGRALDAMAIYEKWSMRTTPEFMGGWLQALENTINANPIKITEVAEMINVMRERINFAIPTESIIWELASVAFFDRNESPYRYDPEYAKDKIARWKGDIGLPAFFFQDPVKGYGQLTGLIRRRFQELFESNGGGTRETIRESAIQTFVRSAEARFLISVRIRTEFSLDANKLNIYEYYMLLEQLDKISRGRERSH